MRTALSRCRARRYRRGVPVPDPAAPDPAVRRALTDALVDDAAVFPPGLAPLPDALRGHLAARRAPWRALVGPLVLPASAVDGLPDLLPGLVDALDPLRLVIVADTGPAGLDAARDRLVDDDRIDLAGIEVALPGDVDPTAGAADLLAHLAWSVPAAVEVPLVPGWEGALDVLAADGAERAKFRLGGAGVPTVEQVAAVLVACRDRRLPFKLTAGLHRAVRGMDRTGDLPHHGFGNVLAAVAAAVDGAAAADVGAVLAETGEDRVAVLLSGIDAATAVAVRRLFRSFGSCSLAGPRDDLVALGVLPLEED